jgi:glycosyltransferase involved in cell wall biosynthesis
MVVAFICNEYPPARGGGIGVFVQSLARDIAKPGHQVIVCGVGDNGTVFRDGDVTVTVLQKTRLGKASWFLDRARVRAWLRKQAVERGVDIVEAAEYDGYLPFPIPECASVIRLHLSATAIRRDAGIRWRGPTYLSEWLTLKLNPNWIAVSNWIMDNTIDLFGIRPNTATTIYNPVTPVQNNGQIRTRIHSKYILFAGTISERKGALVLARAFARASNIYPDLALVYAGRVFTERGRPNDERILELVGERNASRVLFVGELQRSELHQYMRDATVFAFPSRLESFGLVVAEAMQCKVPVIFTQHGPGPEIIKHRISGLLVEPENENALASAIIDILRSPELSANLTREAFNTSLTRFSQEQCTVKTLAYYEAVIREHRSC